MRIRRQTRLPHPGQQLLEPRIPGRIRPQHERVHEQPDKIVQRLIGTPRHTTAQRDVGPRTQPRQQRRHTGLQHHEHRGTGPAGQFRHAPVQRSLDLERDGLTGVRGHCRPGPVGRERHLLGKIRQLVTPVADLLREEAVRVVLVTQQFTLPQRVVRVLHRQLRPLRHTTLRTRRVRRHHIPRQRTHRPPVRRDVVEQQQEDAAVPIRVEEPGPDRCLGGQFETVAGDFPHHCRQLRLGHPTVFPAERGISRIEHHLAGLAAHLGEHRAQRLVPSGHIGQRSVQRLRIHGIGQAEGQRHVVGRGGALQLVQEPQTTLSERQRHHIRPLHRHQRPTYPALATQPLRQERHGRSLEDVLDGKLDADHAADAADQPRHEQGVAAQVEEAVVDPDPFQAQHLGEQPAQRLLLRSTSLPAGRTHRVLRSGQRLAVQLPVRRKRQPVQHHHR